MECEEEDGLAVSIRFSLKPFWWTSEERGTSRSNNQPAKTKTGKSAKKRERCSVNTQETSVLSDQLVKLKNAGTQGGGCRRVVVWEPRSGELWTQQLKSPLMRTQSWKVLPLKPGVGQYIAMHATLTARDFFLANFYPFGPFTCIFSKTSPEFFLLAVANTGSCVGPQNKRGHLAGCKFQCWVLAEYK